MLAVHGGGIAGGGGVPGRQTSGYKFGIGQNASGQTTDGVPGAGGGYYGGYVNQRDGSGGSGFISGYNGCDAILEESTENNILHSGQSIHYSGKYFTDCTFLNGNTSGIPSKPDKNGYVRIKYLGT